MTLARRQPYPTPGTAQGGGVASTITPDAAATEGTAAASARSDHVHGIVAAAASVLTPDQAALEGVSTSFSRADHAHGLPADVAATIFPSSAAGEGVAAAFARADHLHSATAVTPVAVGTANAIGASGGFSRGDHVHAEKPVITCTVKATATQSLSVGQENTDVKVEFDTSVENVGCTFDNANDEIEILTAGVYACEVEIPFANAATMIGVRCGHLLKNPRGTPVTISHVHGTPGGTDGASNWGNEVFTVLPHHSGVRLAVGDRIGCTALKRTNNGAAIAIDLVDTAPTPDHWPRMTVTRIGA